MAAVHFSRERTRRRITVVFFLWSLISLSCAARLPVSKQKLDVQKHLERLNKPAVESIKSADGDVIDCVPISQQPAFDHPFLKDHKIQMRPNYHPEGLYDENKVSTQPKDRTNPISQLWHTNGKCPEGTIPIRRTKKDDVLRASSIKRYGKKKHRTIPQPRSADPGLMNENGHQVMKFLSSQNDHKELAPWVILLSPNSGNHIEAACIGQGGGDQFKKLLNQLQAARNCSLEMVSAVGEPQVPETLLLSPMSTFKVEALLCLPRSEQHKLTQGGGNGDSISVLIPYKQASYRRCICTSVGRWRLKSFRWVNLVMHGKVETHMGCFTDISANVECHKNPYLGDTRVVGSYNPLHAIAYVEGDKYFGAKATINVWEPKIQQPNEFSLSQLWVLGGSFGEDLNSIEAGWQVSPDLYGDNNTRLFTYWTSDAYQATGCYNLLCSGFIQINSEIAMGASISPVSGFRNSQYDISILIWKDPKEGNWWMQFGNDYVMGYWPSFLFSYLADSASMIEWGGEVVNSQPDGQHTSTQMGSGHFPEEGFSKSSYFRNIQIVDQSNNLKAPRGIGTFTEQSNCYDVQSGSNGDWGHYIYYGGPGRNPNCP